MSESFRVTHKHSGQHGLAGYWWFLTNGIDPRDVTAGQDLHVDDDGLAHFTVYVRDQAGRKILDETVHGFVRETVSRKVTYMPSVYGLPRREAVSA
jgi:phosphoribosyl 1,2-cyclic phosphodiesterase